MTIYRISRNLKGLDGRWDKDKARVINFTVQIDEQICAQNKQGLERLNDRLNKGKARVAIHKTTSRDLNGWMMDRTIMY